MLALPGMIDRMRRVAAAIGLWAFAVGCASNARVEGNGSTELIFHREPWAWESFGCDQIHVSVARRAAGAEPTFWIETADGRLVRPFEADPTELTAAGFARADDQSGTDPAGIRYDHAVVCTSPGFRFVFPAGRLRDLWIEPWGGYGDPDAEPVLWNGERTRRYKLPLTEPDAAKLFGKLGVRTDTLSL